MTNDPEIRDAVSALHTAHAELLRSSANLLDALQAYDGADDALARLVHALEAETLYLRALAGHIECPNPLIGIYDVAARALEGQP